jgi:hypothetical protein
MEGIIMKAISILAGAFLSVLFSVALPAFGSQTEASSITAPDTVAYIYITNVIGSANDPNAVEGSGSCVVQPGRGPCSGVMYVRGRESGQSVGSIINNLDSVQFEVLYSLSMDYVNSVPSLLGSIYALQMDPSGKITGGEKLLVHDTLRYGEERTLKFTSMNPPKPITMTFKVLREAPTVQVAYGSATLSLISTQSIGGKPWSTSGKTVPLFVNGQTESPRHFESRFTSKPTGSKQITLNYEVEVAFTPPLIRDKLPARSELEFSRMYWVTDTTSQSASRAAQWGTGTTFKKQVEIVPGKVLKLIFPSDQPPVAGFQIEDTLIVVP